MSSIVARTLFNTTVVERSWKTQFTSGVIHVLVIGGAFLMVVPAVKNLQSTSGEHVTLVAPVPARPHVVVALPHFKHVAKLTMPVLPVIPPPVAPVVLAKSVPVARPVTPELKIEAESKASLPVPKPVTKTGTFEDLQTAKTAPVAKQVIVGGFGDPRGVQSSDMSRPQPVLMARVGSFESPTGAGQTGGGGHLDSGVKAAGFGSVTTDSGGNTGKANLVQTGHFGDSGGTAARAGSGSVRSTGFENTIAAAPQKHDPPTSVPAFTPVEILFKPRPAYSAEARGMHLEGQVSLEVVFQASGAVKVVRVIKGLGHGLDEAAQQAALQVRFKPATRGGAPIDTSATISITFELA